MRPLTKPLILAVLLGTAVIPLAHRRPAVATPTPTGHFSLFEAKAAEPDVAKCGFVGRYGLTLQGTIPVGVTVTGVGIATVGNGKLSGNVTGTNSTGSTAQTPISGTYHLNDDCTGTFSLTFDNVHFTLLGTGVLVDRGRELHTVITSPSNMLLSGTGRKQ